MKCPFCSSTEHKVIDKRNTPDRTSTRRRRTCLKCERRFTTYERVELGNKVVVKKDGTREAFDREKLQKGVLIACQKRPVEIEAVDVVLEGVESDVRQKDSNEIASTEIGSMVMKRLKRVDKVAYIRFASVYREFKDLEEFQKELTKLNKGR